MKDLDFSGKLAKQVGRSSARRFIVLGIAIAMEYPGYRS